MFFSCFRELKGCFQKLMNYVRPDIGLFILRERHRARMRGFVIRPEIWNPLIFSFAKVQIDIPLYISQWRDECLSRHRGKFYNEIIGESWVFMKEPKAISCTYLQHLTYQSKRGRIWPGNTKLNVTELPSYWSCRSCFALPFPVIRMQISLFKASFKSSDEIQFSSPLWQEKKSTGACTGADRHICGSCISWRCYLHLKPISSVWLLQQ